MDEKNKNLVDNIIITEEAFSEWKRICDEFIETYFIEHNRIPDLKEHEEAKLVNDKLILYCELENGGHIEYEIPDEEWVWKS